MHLEQFSSPCSCVSSPVALLVLHRLLCPLGFGGVSGGALCTSPLSFTPSIARRTLFRDPPKPQEGIFSPAFLGPFPSSFSRAGWKVGSVQVLGLLVLRCEQGREGAHVAPLDVLKEDAGVPEPGHLTCQQTVWILSSFCGLRLLYLFSSRSWLQGAGAYLHVDLRCSS